MEEGSREDYTVKAAQAPPPPPCPFGSKKKFSAALIKVTNFHKNIEFRE
jgi:hypothetical protein